MGKIIVLTQVKVRLDNLRK